MSEMAKVIQVQSRGAFAQVLVDGEEIPWHIARDTIRVDVQPDECPTVTLTLLADRVEVLDSIEREE